MTILWSIDLSSHLKFSVFGDVNNDPSKVQNCAGILCSLITCTATDNHCLHFYNQQNKIVNRNWRQWCNEKRTITNSLRSKTPNSTLICDRKCTKWTYTTFINTKKMQSALTAFDSSKSLLENKKMPSLFLDGRGINIHTDVNLHICIWLKQIFTSS